MIVYFPIFKIYVMLCLIGQFKRSIIQLKPTRQYPVPVVTSWVITAEPVKTGYPLFVCPDFFRPNKTSSPKGNDRSPESNVPRSNLISKNSNSSKLQCLFLLHESIKRIQSKTTEKKWKHHFPNYKVYRGIS